MVRGVVKLRGTGRHGLLVSPCFLALAAGTGGQAASGTRAESFNLVVK